MSATVDLNGVPPKHGDAPVRHGFWALALGSVGVVYGDIGTSPLYTLREAFGPAGGLHMSETGVLGVLSLVFWSLIVIVTLKYVILILRADNRGEGGVLALMALVSRQPAINPRRRRLYLMRHGEVCYFDASTGRPVPVSSLPAPAQPG